MVSHTADNTDTFTTTTGQHKGETAVPLTFRGIVIPRKIVVPIQDPPQQSFRRDGSRIAVGPSLSEQRVFKDTLHIENPNEFDVSHCGH